MNTDGISKITITIIIAVVAIVVAAGGVLAYTMTTQTNTGGNTGTTGTTAVTGTTGVTTQSTGSAVSNASWDKYLGYIPQGYQVAAREPNAPVFPCPTGMTTAQCTLFQQTCGNGVCDPNETCSTCPIDCGVTGSLVCDPYTGRAGAPASVCQVQLQQAAANQAG